MVTVAQRSILFVDDEETIVNSLRMLFRRKKEFKVYTTTDQHEALDIVEKNKVHVVVSDMRMPGMNGAELLSEVKKKSPNTMRLLLTGYSEMDNIISSINKANVYRFLEKPWANVDIVNKITEASLISNTLWDKHPMSLENITDSIKEKSGKEIVAGDQAILFIGPESSSVLMGLNGAFQLPLFRASTIQQAIALLVKNRNILVMVIHSQKNYRNVTSLLKILKSEFPMIVSVVVTSDADSHTAIGLVNEAQVFRYLREPYEESQLHNDVKAAINYAETLKVSPILLGAHKVDDMSKEEKDFIILQIGTNFLNKVGKRFQKWFC